MPSRQAFDAESSDVETFAAIRARIHAAAALACTDLAAQRAQAETILETTEPLLHADTAPHLAALCAHGIALGILRRYDEAEHVLRQAEMRSLPFRSATVTSAIGQLSKQRLEDVGNAGEGSVGTAPADARAGALLEVKSADQADSIAGSVKSAPPAAAGAPARSPTASRHSPAGSVAKRADETDVFDDLERWLSGDGHTQFDDLYMRKYGEGNRGVHAKADIPPGRDIMAIGSKFLITVEMGQSTAIGQAVQHATPALALSTAKHCYIAIFVLVDRRNPGSFFQPYYRILPSTYPNMPLFWSDEELSWLEGSPVQRQVIDRRASIAADYEAICRAAPSFREIASPQEFMWARVVVASRNFGISMYGRKTDALVPLADMLNHHRPRETKWAFDSSQDAFVMTSLLPLQAGQQVYDSYGMKCQSRWLLSYGCAIEHNRDDGPGKCHNEIRTHMFMPAEVPATVRRMVASAGLSKGVETLTEGGPPVPYRTVHPSMFADHASTIEMFSWARICTVSEEEFRYCARMSHEADLTRRAIGAVSPAAEARALNLIADTMRATLAQYPTTIEQDIAELASGSAPFGSNRRNALILLRSEKEVAGYYVALAEAAVPLLTTVEPRRALERIDAEYYRDHDVDKYMHSNVKPLVQRRLNRLS